MDSRGGPKFSTGTEIRVTIVVQMQPRDGRYRISEIYYDAVRKRDQAVEVAQVLALALTAGAVFLLVASNLLLVGLRLHDGVGDRHRLAPLRCRPAFRRQAEFSTLTGLIVVIGLRCSENCWCG